ncbi:MAG: TlpA disulfide reductase family protein [Bacteroidota bacterium]
MHALIRVVCLLFCFLPFRGDAQSEVQCRLKLIDFQPSSLSASFLEHSLSGELKTYRFQLKADGTANFILPVDRPSLVKFQLDEYSFFSWLSPDEMLEATINASGNIQFKSPNPQDQAQLNRLSAPVLQNTWLFAYPEDRSLIDAALQTNIEARSWEAHVQACQQTATHESTLRESIQHPNLSYQLKHALLATRAADQLAYFLVHDYRYASSDITNEIRRSGILDYIPMNDQYLINNAEYLRFLSIYLQVERLKLSSDLRPHWLILADLIEQRFNGKIQHRLLGRLCVEAFRTGESEGLEYAFRKLYQLAPGSEEVQYLDGLVGESLRFDEEGPAPGFELPNPEGQIVALRDFKGKIVYLSVWATWCKPCLAGFEKSRYLREELIKRGVVLINVSVDKDEQTWQQTMGRVPMPGINLLSNDNTFMQAYNITALPVYHIIDKNGKFTYLPEGSRNILEEFERMVND